MAKALHLHAVLHPGFDRRWVRRVLDTGGLVLALGRPSYLPPTEAHTAGHFVSVVGMSDGEFVVNDPYRRTTKKAVRYRVTPKTLESFVRHKPNGQLFAIYS